jgi:hypothetical protein
MRLEGGSGCSVAVSRPRWCSASQRARSAHSSPTVAYACASLKLCGRAEPVNARQALAGVASCRRAAQAQGRGPRLRYCRVSFMMFVAQPMA